MQAEWRRFRLYSNHGNIAAVQALLPGFEIPAYEDQELLQLALLMGVQLQRASPAERGAFLNSPYGNMVLQVLRELSEQEQEGRQYRMTPWLDAKLQGAAAAAVAAPTWSDDCSLTTRELVEVLLLPGLLLQPTASASPARSGMVAAGDSNSGESVDNIDSSSSSSSTATSTTGPSMGGGSGCISSQGPPAAPVQPSAGGPHLFVELGKGGRLEMVAQWLWGLAQEWRLGCFAWYIAIGPGPWFGDVGGYPNFVTITDISVGRKPSGPEGTWKGCAGRGL
jgi:hypothetical protein